MSDEKWPKGPLYGVDCGGKNKFPIWLWLMCVYAGLVTGALICVCGLGAWNIHILSDNCNGGTIQSDKVTKQTLAWTQTEETTVADSIPEAVPLVAKHTAVIPHRYILNDTCLTMHELVDIDLEKEQETFYVTSSSETKSGMITVDFKTHMLAMFISDGRDRCFIVHNIAHEFADPNTLIKILQGDKDQGLDCSRSLSFDDPEHLKHYDGLPPALETMCWGKHIYKLHKVGKSTGSNDRQHGEVIIAVVTGQETLFLVVRN